MDLQLARVVDQRLIDKENQLKYNLQKIEEELERLMESPPQFPGRPGPSKQGESAPLQDYCRKIMISRMKPSFPAIILSKASSYGMRAPVQTRKIIYTLFPTKLIIKSLYLYIAYFLYNPVLLSNYYQLKYMNPV